MIDLAHRFYAAMVVPFDSQGRVDEPAYRELIQYYMQEPFRSVGGLIVNPEAGEVYYLTRQEKRRLVELAIRETNGRMPVFGGVFELTTEGCVACALDAKAAGVDGLL